MGKSAVDRFLNLIEQHKLFQFERMATKKEDIEEHWDLIVSHPTTSPFPWIEEGHAKTLYRTEVKSMKRVRRGDSAPTDETIVIEIRGVQPQKKEIVNHGWLWGKADIFAFEMNDGFWLIESQKLRKVIIELGELYKIDFTAHPDLGKGKKLYKLYGRFGRGDKFIYVRKEDLLKTAPYILGENS